jgi:drug/metabolite transporter (DMT)-like permease
MSRALAAYITLLAGIFLISSNFIVGAYGKTIPPWQLAFLRFFIAFIILLPFTFSTLKKTWPILRSHGHLLFIYGILGITIPGGFAYISLQETTAINGAFIFATSPIFTLMIAWILLREKLSLLQWLGVIITLLGVLTIISKGEINLLLTVKFTTGDLWMLANAICWAFYTVLIKRWKIAVDSLSLLTATLAMGLVGILPFGLYELWHHAIIILNPRNMLTVIYAGTFAGAFAYLAYIRGVMVVGPAKAGLFTYMMPLFATLQAYFFLNEQLHLYLLLAVILIAIGILLTVFFDPQR